MMMMSLNLKVVESTFEISALHPGQFAEAKKSDFLPVADYTRTI